VTTPDADGERVALRCAACGNIVRVVSAAVAKAFGSGSWLCAGLECFARREAARAAGDGRLV
jgi:hypothetical protein